MRSLLFSVLFVTNLVPTGCAQPPTTMKETPNPLLCDPDTGVCAMPGSTGADAVATQNTVPASRAITLLYFTDPICSSCWGAEPQLRRLKM